MRDHCRIKWDGVLWMHWKRASHITWKVCILALGELEIMGTTNYKSNCYDTKDWLYQVLKWKVFMLSRSKKSICINFSKLKSSCFLMFQLRTQILGSDFLMFLPGFTILPAVWLLASYLIILALNLTICKLQIEIIPSS